MPPLSVITLADWSRTLYCTDQEALKRFLRTVLKTRGTDKQPISLIAQIQILLEDWLNHLGFLTDAQRFEIQQQIRTQLVTYTEVLQAALERKQPLPMFRLVIGDYRWVSCDGRESFFDLIELEDVKEIPHEAVTNIICDVTALYLRARRRLGRVQQNNE